MLYIVATVKPQPSSSHPSLLSPLVANANTAFLAVLRALVQSGEEVLGGRSRSIGSERKTLELRNVSITLEQPRARIVRLPVRTLNLPVAIARFVWLAAGSNTLGDIAFYEPRAAMFSDDGFTVRGSNTGQRILRPHPGLNQLHSILERLRKDLTSRRAVIALYHPDDAARESVDIPCAIAFTCLVREDGLHATALMRSSNAVGLLPYDIFELSLLGELISTELGVKFATYTHFSTSMHIYENDYNTLANIAAAEINADAFHMQSMPTSPSPLKQLEILVELERSIRNHTLQSIEIDWKERVAAAEELLCAYWLDFFKALLWFCLVRRKRYEEAHSLASSCELPLSTPHTAMAAEHAS